MIRIDSDLFDIAQRLKAIDRGYVVFYNPDNRKYLLYKEERGKVEYQLAFPFDSLDARCIDFCFKTRVERARELLIELENENLKNEKTQIHKAKKTAEKKAEEFINMMEK